MPAARNYSSVAVETTLSATVTNSATSWSVGSVTGWPTAPFSVVCDPGQVTEEIVTVTNVVGTTLTVTRGQDSTTGVGHNAGATVRHMVTARDLQEAGNHVGATTNVHGLGVGSAVVGTTDTQTLITKTMSPAANSGVALVVKGLASQIGDLTQWQNSGGATLAKINASGDLTCVALTSTGITILGGAAQTNTSLVAFAGNSSTIPLRARGALSQTADLQRWENSTPTTLASVSSAGQFTGPGVTLTGASTITASAAGVIPLTVKGAVSQTADLIKVQDSSGNDMWRVDSAGAMRTAIGIFPSSILAQPLSAAINPLIVKGFTGQTADLLQAQDSAGTVLAAITKDGVLTSKAHTATATTSATKALIAKGAASQSASLFEAQDSAGTSQFAVGPAGAITGTAFPAEADAFSTTDINFTSTTYTAGTPAVSTTFVAPVSGKVMVHLHGGVGGNATSGTSCLLSTQIRLTDVNGAIFEDADDDLSISIQGAINLRSGFSHVVSGLTAGSTYFIRTMHRSSTSNACDVFFRRITVVPLVA